MTGELQRRVNDWLPADLTDPAEIRAALEGTEWVSGLNRSTTRGIVDGVASRRDVADAPVDRDAARQTSVVGSTENRQVQLRDAEGQLAGKEENISTWEDRWGNVMFENSETGRRGKLVDSDDR